MVDFSGQSAHETISCSECRSVFCDLIVCVLIEGAHRFRAGICLSDTRQEIIIKVRTIVGARSGLKSLSRAIVLRGRDFSTNLSVLPLANC